MKKDIAQEVRESHSACDAWLQYGEETNKRKNNKRRKGRMNKRKKRKRY